MSVFVEHQKTICDFSNSDSWIILSPIEQSIKRKIESVGTPLKDWDISIYRGVLTGYNDAFIITTEKRDEILSNCQTDDERRKTEELIRPILRGRDIKRYGYNWADLWLINTHNGIKGKLPRIDVEEYPAIKAHLDQYWPKLKNRADKGDTPYNLRNCAYLEDFERQRIIYREIGIEMDACMVDKGWMVNNKLYMISGSHLNHLINFLNSKLFNKIILTTANLTGGKGVDFLEKVVVPSPEQCDLSNANERTTALSLYKLYDLSDNEIQYIENQ